MSAGLGKIKTAANALCWVCALLSLVFTARRQFELFRPVEISVAAAPGDERVPAVRAEELEKILRQRINSLRQTADGSWDGEEDVPSDAILNRPLLALRGVVSSGGGQWAAVAVEGSARMVLIVPGQSLNGVKILAIDQTGMTCQWRGQKFFVPLE